MTWSEYPRPKFAHPLKLKQSQVVLIERELEQGAEWKGLWSYHKSIRRPVPSVEDAGFIRNEIDRFILAKLNERGMRPGPEAYLLSHHHNRTLSMVHLLISSSHPSSAHHLLL